MISDALKLLASLFGWFTGWRERRAAKEAQAEARAPVEAAVDQLQAAQDALRRTEQYNQGRVNAPLDYHRDDLNRQ